MPIEDEGAEGVVRMFLIADVRGYTRFTQTYGDEAAAELAGRFARLTREVVTAGGGELIELRGDEALAVFTSPRQALRTAIEVQRRLRGGDDPEEALPLGIGIGLDTGEAVPVEGGYRGKALKASSPGAAADKWAEADQAIVDASPIVPVAILGYAQFVSQRVGNFQSHPFWGPMYGQMWVR